MFEQIRASLQELLDGARSPADRRAVLTDMKQTLVSARLGVEDLRKGVDEARERVAAAQQELATIRRRRDLATGIGDRDTVAVAERFERLQAERVAVLEQKLAVQTRELSLLETEVAEMGAEFRRAASGAPGAPAGAADRAAAREVDDLLGADGALSADMRQMARDQERTARDADADERLAALKRRMGK